MSIFKLSRKMIQRMDDLPLLPGVIVNLMSLDRQGDDFFDQVVDVVMSEPNFAVRVLSVANSASYAGQEPVSNLRTAVSRIGSAETANLVLGVAVSRIFVPSNDWERSLWRHTIHVANAARELAMVSKDSELSPDVAYTAGLVHDLGRFVMFQEAPQELKNIDEGDWESMEEQVMMEKKICGVTHTELGAMACQKWHIPSLIEEVVERHHQRRPTPLVHLHDKLVALVNVADIAMFPSAMLHDVRNMDEVDDSELQQSVQRRLPRFVQMPLDELRALLKRSRMEADEVFRSLGL